MPAAALQPQTAAHTAWWPRLCEQNAYVGITEEVELHECLALGVPEAPLAAAAEACKVEVSPSFSSCGRLLP